MKLEAILEREIEEFKAKVLAQGYAPKTINNILSILRKSLDTALEWRCITFVPKVKWLRVPKQEIEVISSSAERLLIDDYSEPMTNAIIVVALRTGLRKGEILALRWKDIDLQNNTIHVNGSININHERAATKNGRIRSIPMSYEVRTRLLSLQASQGRSEGYIFDAGDGTPLTVRQIDRRLEHIKNNLGITEHLYWHKFRHTFASNLAKRGVNMRILQELMGHSTIIMTERYSHVDMASKQSAIQLLDYANEEYGQNLGRFVYNEVPVKQKQSRDLALLREEI